MAYKYKLREKETERRRTIKPKDVSPDLIKRLEDLYGPVDLKNDFFSSDLDTYFKTTKIFSKEEGGGVEHKVIPLASFEESLRKITGAFESLKDLLKSDEAKSDSNIQDVARDIKQALNKFRAHLRKFYPEQYKLALAKLNEATGVEEISTSGAAGAYNTKYAFKKPKKQKDLEENISATMGPGPKAGPDGVKDNYYVKKFKYKVVPKDKNGNYVQKGSGLEVKNF